MAAEEVYHHRHHQAIDDKSSSQALFFPGFGYKCTYPSTVLYPSDRPQDLV